MVVPKVFRFVIKYVTPFFILAIFTASLIKPEGDWASAFGSLFTGNGYPFAHDSVIGQIFHVGVEDYRWFRDGAPTHEFIKDITRFLLMLTFAAIAAAIYYSWNKKEKQLKKGDN